MGDDFDKEMHDADWEEVYERQAARGDVVPDLGDLLGLEPGDPVLELGSGPGYTAFRLAERVAPGVVYAVDRQLGALRYLRGMATKEGIEDVRAIASDAGTLALRFDDPTPALAAFVLHHVDSPDRAIAEVADALPTGSPFLVAEYHPDGAGDVGPPIEHRIAPGRTRGWLTGAGFTIETTTDLPEEKYAVLARA